MRNSIKTVIGYAVLKDKEEFLSWLRDSGWARKNSRHSTDGWYGGHWSNYFYNHQNVFNDARNIFEDSVNNEWGQPVTEKFFAMLDYLDSMNYHLP